MKIFVIQQKEDQMTPCTTLGHCTYHQMNTENLGGLWVGGAIFVGNVLVEPSFFFFSLFLSFSFRFAQQWWDAKREHWDCIVFFRKGYFYELFNQDADIGRRVLNLKGSLYVCKHMCACLCAYMCVCVLLTPISVTSRGEMKLAGVPQTQLEPWAARLVQNG